MQGEAEAGAFMHIQICMSHGLCKTWFYAWTMVYALFLCTLKIAYPMAYAHKKKSKKKASRGDDFDEDKHMHLHKPWAMHQKCILHKP